MAETRKKSDASKQSGRTRQSGAVKQSNMTDRKTEQNADENKEIRLEVILLVILAISIFLFLANFGICGMVGNAVSGFLFGFIGFAEYIFPVYLFIASAFIISNPKNKKVRNEVIYIGVILMLVSMTERILFL